METSPTANPKVQFLRTPPRALPHLQLVIPYTTPELTQAALKSAAIFAHNLEATVRLLHVHVLPYPRPLDQPDVSSEHLENKLADAAGQCPLPVRAEVVYARDRQEAFRQLLPPGSLVLIATRTRWWPTAQQRLAHSLSRAGHSVALLAV
jgi:hypothetical protein